MVHKKALRTGYRLIVAVAGVAVIAAGIVMLPFPGPGWLTIFLGLGILASEFPWARRLLHVARTLVGAWWHWLAGQSLWVRGSVTVAGLGLVAASLLLALRVTGVPTWLPDWLTVGG